MHCFFLRTGTEILSNIAREREREGIVQVRGEKVRKGTKVQVSRAVLLMYTTMHSVVKIQCTRVVEIHLPVPGSGQCY